MATRADIEDDITLELEGRGVTPERFLKSIRAFFGIVREVTKDVCAVEETQPKWRVQVKDGSNLVGISPRPGYISPALLDAITDRVRRGIETLEDHSEEPTWFPRPAIQHLRDLGSVVGAKEGEDVFVRVWLRKEPVGVTQKSAANAAELLREAYTDHGSVEGRLQVASERGDLHVVIYEPVWDKPIRCYLDDDLMQRALGCFGKRVTVTGAVKYRTDGTPTSVTAENFEVFPDGSGLPGIDAITGILRNYA